MIELAVAGGILLVLELIVPGGIVGTLGVLFLLGSLYMFLGATIQALFITAGVGLVLALLAVVMLRLLPSLAQWNPVTLQYRGSRRKGYQSIDERKDLLGKSGVVTMVLRPVGVVCINDEYVNVVTEGAFYEVGTAVEVVEVKGTRIVVRAV